jgi:molybdopterin/thiamine biosynthesis adenylyltransferase
MTKKRNVMIIGAGGIGSFFIPLLNRTKLYKLTVYDPDIVETKNLTYQNFEETDVDEKKVDAVAKHCNISAQPFPVLTAKQLKGFDLVVCCADNLDIRRTMYNSKVKWLDLRAQGRNGAMISHLEDPKLYSTFTTGPDGSFSCQGNSWEGDASGVHFMQVVMAGYGAQWVQRWFNGEDVKKHFTING